MILLVDDDPGIREIIVLMLSGEFNVVEFSNPSDALQAIIDNPEMYNLIISDYNMPGMNGIQLSYAIREVTTIPYIVIITGNPQNISEHDIINADIKKVIQKPFDYREIIELVKSLVD